MNPQQDQYIISALKAGFGPSQIAQGLGVTPSAVNQIIEARNLKALVEENSQFKEIDDGLNEIERRVVNKLKRSINTDLTLTPMQLTAILKTVNGAKRRSLSEGQNLVDNSVRLVQLNINQRHLPKVVHNAQNEVIEVDGQVLQTIPSGQLAKKAYENETPKTIRDLL